MSEMPSHAAPSRAPDHARHDPLLVAQSVAGDPLDEEQAREARAWLATCSACVALATDLRRVSAMVAAEPVPARRRDFRLTAEQAEAAQGNAISRFLRGLSLPRARAFGPAAAGIMSLGFVFVVAGYAWPDDGTVTIAPETNVAAPPLEAPPATAPALVLTTPAAELAPGADFARGADFTPEAATAEEDARIREGDPDDAAAAFAVDPEFLEELAEHQAGTSARSEMQKALESELTDELTLDDLAAADEVGSAEADGVAVAGDAADGSDVGDGSAEPPAAPVDAPPVADAVESSLAPVDAPPVAGAVDPLLAPVETSDAGVPDASAQAEDDERALAWWLGLVGVALAIGGGALLLLGWLARRTEDPALR